MLNTLTVRDFVVVQSKLLVPSVAGLLHRPRVCELLVQGLERKLTVVSAPAGYGKTSVLVDFARSVSLPVCWYTIDERDCDLSVFVRYLVASIQRQHPGFGEETLTRICDADPGALQRDPMAIVGDLANEILNLGRPLALVLDNFEPADSAPGIREFVRWFIEVQPSNCHIYIGSRVLPDVPVTRLVAKRQLVGVGVEDLRFEVDEVSELLERVGIVIGEAEAAEISEQSEGWVTGILLLAELAADRISHVLSQSGRVTPDTYSYLTSEVLRSQPPDVQRFLRRSSVLREMSVQLCRDILGLQGAHGLLSEVERRNLFVTRFGTGGGAFYRYHNLFRQFLQEELRCRDRETFVDLHLRAAAWFDLQNEPEEEIQHLLAGEAFAEAATLMERVALEWFTRGRSEMLHQWAEALPGEMREQAPLLALYQSRVLTDRYCFAEALQALERAEAGFSATSDTARLARVHSQRALLATMEGDYSFAVDQARSALDMLDEEDVLERGLALRHLGKAYLAQGRFDEGIEHLATALSQINAAHSPYDEVHILQELSVALYMRGDVQEAMLRLNEAVGLGRRLGSASQLSMLLNDLATMYHDQGEYGRALALFEEGLGAARRATDPRGEAYVLMGMAEVHRDIGDYGRAEPLYAEARAIAGDGEAPLAVDLLVAWADMFRWQGRLDRAHALLAEARALASERELQFQLSGVVQISEGISLVESGDLAQGQRMLMAGIHYLRERDAIRELARARFLLAKSLLKGGDQQRAVAQLSRSLSMAQQTNSLHFAVVEGQHAEALLKLGLSAGLGVCQQILADIRDLRSLSGQLDGHLSSQDEETPVRQLEVYALGEGQVVRDGDLVQSADWQAAMAKEMFFYILLHGPISRDEIGLVFWPDLPTKRMADSFHTTIYRIRKAVGSDAVVTEDGLYRVGHIAYWFDAEEFERLVERARLLPPYDWQAEDLWRRAVMLYRGDFLPEVDRLWVVPKREALRDAQLDALVGLGRCYEARKRVAEAVSWYQRALDVDPLRDDVHLRIMRCYVKAGRRAEALVQYRHCSEILERELGVAPWGELEALYQEIIE